MDNPMERQRVPAFHGYAPADALELEFVPPLTITITRETGSWGRAIARLTAKQLGWDFVTQESLEYGTSHPVSAHRPDEDSLSTAAEAWVEGMLAFYAERSPLPGGDEFVRSVLELAAVGNYVLLGNCGRFLLPTKAQLAVHLVAPEKQRIAYIAETERLTMKEAEQHVRTLDAASRNERRSWHTFANGQPEADLTLNTAQFGIDGCVAIISAAARERQEYLCTQQDS